MSWLSKATGIHVSPKGASLSAPDPLGTLGDIAHNPLPLLGLALPGVGTGLSSILGLGGGAAAASAIPEAAMGISGGGGLSGLLGSAGSFLLGNGGKNALGLATGVESALQGKKSNDLANQALGTVQSAYTEKAPLRAQGLQGLLHPTAPDLSSLSQIAGQVPGQSSLPKAGALQQFQAPASVNQALPIAGSLSQFTPPQKSSAMNLQALLRDAGNPYAKQA